ncbi:MAG: hypothetical protein OXR73_19290 [Myxococcales bacterium]|nr:hypothetical protein [Myxococcales bacterium]
MLKWLFLILGAVTLLGCMWEVHEAEGCEEGELYSSYDDSDSDEEDWRRRSRDGDPDDRQGDARRAREQEEQADADAGPPSCETDEDCEEVMLSYCDSEMGSCVSADPCTEESQCEPGYNCDPDRGLCLPTSQERCSELADESTCADRSDCESTYAGVDCSCGPDCTCKGDEPDCVCARYEFFVCAEATD